MPGRPGTAGAALLAVGDRDRGLVLHGVLRGGRDGEDLHLKAGLLACSMVSQVSDIWVRCGFRLL